MKKNDLNTTDMHSFIHPLAAAVPPSWESKSDWDIFRILAGKVSELAKTHMPEPVRDLVAMPLQHDTPAEMAQALIRDWARGECEPIPGVTMPNFVVTERDYVNLGKRFISFVFDYIEMFYNRIRRHSHLGQMSPIDFEQAALNQA